MRKIPVLSLAFILLAACGGSDVVSCDRGYWDGEVGTCVPDGWQVMDRGQLDQQGMPSEVHVAFQSETPVSGQLVTVTVTTEALSNPLSPADYSEASIQSVKGLPGYEEIDRKPVTVDGQDLDIHVFTAQPTADQPASRFYQLSSVAEETGYTFTAATPVTVSDDVEAQILSMYESATFVEPAEGE